MNLGYNLRRSAIYFPKKNAVIFSNSFLSYSHIEKYSNRFGNFLKSVGINKGDKVCIYLPNIPEFIICFFGIVKIGAIAVSISSLWKRDEVLYVIEDSEADALITTDELIQNIAGRDLAERVKRIIIIGKKNEEYISYKSAIEGCSEELTIMEMDRDDVASIIYTSGTTGKPKGAMLTHGNVISNAFSAIHHTLMKPDDILICFLPLYHSFGQNFIMNSCICRGATLVLHKKFEIDEIVHSIKNNRVTRFFGVPAIYIKLLNEEKVYPFLGSLEYCFSAAASMPAEVSKRWKETFGLTIFEGYGLTETTPFASYNHDISYRSGSIGTPIENVEMKVVDENGEQLPPGKLGEIVIKGPNVMKGYYNKPEETEKTIRNGWLYSGDIGMTDDDGYFYIVDRVKDMINSAGFKIWPREVEEVLFKHPAVMECAVVGVPDNVYGERVKAFVILKEGQKASAEELISFCKEKIASYKAPKEIEFVKEIPKSPTGKILKRILREEEKSKAKGL